MTAMSLSACPKLRPFAPDLLRYWLQLPEEHCGLPDELSDPQALLARLRSLELLTEAARLLAYALPEREAIWWSCMCVRHTMPSPAGAEGAAVEAAEAWVRQPGATARHEAGLAATGPGYAAPGAWSALGASWSQQKKLLRDLCPGRGAAMAVTRSAIRHDPTRKPQRLRRFIESGIDVGRGGAGRLPEETATSEVNPCHSS